MLIQHLFLSTLYALLVISEIGIISSSSPCEQKARDKKKWCCDDVDSEDCSYIYKYLMVDSPVVSKTKIFKNNSPANRIMTTGSTE